MDCALCTFHDDNRQEPARLIINGTSVCEQHAEWMMNHWGGPSAEASTHFNTEVNDLEGWM